MEGTVKCTACRREIHKAEQAYILYSRANGKAEGSHDRGPACQDCIEAKATAGEITRVSALAYEAR